MYADTRSYRCKVCNKDVEYTFPVKIEWHEDYKIVIPVNKKHYKAVARFNHNQTHKGDLDIY